MNGEIVIGIDLGTTNSEAAVYIDGRIEMIPVDDGGVMMPSVVGIAPDGRLLVGTEALNQYALYPEKTIRSVKRKMGTDEKLKLGDREYLPQEISAMILRKFREYAEAKLGRPISKAVITVPAQFNDAQRQATRDAGRIAGLEVLRIINEPTAACLAYESDKPLESKYILAFDLGGGTFDVSLVKIEGDITEVVASHGDNHLGGDDFDQAVSEWLQQDIYAREDAPETCSATSEYRLLKAAENAKIHLSEFAYANIIEDALSDKSGGNFAVDRELSLNEFNEIIHPFVEKTLLAVRQCLADAKIKAGEIDDIIMVGGSTRSAVFHETIEREFGIRPRNDVHPDLAVAYGAGLMAARLMGEKTQQILIDITPYTFGISCMGYLNGEYSPFLFAPIIKAGAPLPIMKEDIFQTSYENQEKVEIMIFQGEDPDSRNNIFIGRFMIEELSPQPTNSPIVVGMRLDLDGVLKVSAVEKCTGKTKHISIEDAMAKLSDQQLASSTKHIEAMFNSGIGKIDEPENDMSAETVNSDSFDSEKAIRQRKKFEARIVAVTDKMDKIDRNDANKLLKRMNSAIETADDETIKTCVTELEEILFYLE